MHAAPEVNGGGDASWKDSFKTAQMITLPDVTRICGDQAGQLVQGLARGAGCPEEFILMPLLSCCSALMGHRSEIQVHTAWSEPAVLWIIVGAGAGTRKSAALRQVLSPLLALAEDKKRKCQRPEQQDHVTTELQLPVIYTGVLNMPQLRVLLHDGGGHVLHLTERLEDIHRQLGMHAQHVDNIKAASTQLHDLYEAFAGTLGLSPSAVSGASSGVSPSSLCQAVCYNQCGFACPEYVVNLTVKAPTWLSGRFLISCPPMEDNNTTAFSLPGKDSDEDENSSSEDERHSRAKRARIENKKLTLKDVYFNIARAHSQVGGLRYVFTKDALHELRRFQEEEWCTIVKQLGGEDNGGVVGKSLGQIVRLAGVLKALSEAAKSDLRLDDAVELQTENTAKEMIVKVSGEEVSRAVELGKYFLEQKLSMTFMVSTGFFRRSSTSQQSQDSNLPMSVPSTPTSSDFSFMPPPADPGSALYGIPKLSGTFLSPSSVAVSLGGAMPGGSNHQQHSLPQGLPMTSLATPSAATQPFPFSVQGGPHSSALSSLMMRGNAHLTQLPASAPASSPSTPSPSSSSTSHPRPPEIDVSQLPATWIPATPEEEMAEMSQAAEFVQLEPAQFVAVHARRVKRLLECFDDGCGVSATTAAQKSIAPPVRVAGTNNRHPAWASALFFQKVADLGLGVAEQVRHPTNGRVYWRFKRKPLSELTERNYQLLQYLRIDMLRFSRQGHPTMHMPGLDLDPVPGGAAVEHNIDEEGSNSASSKGNSSPLESDIKQEMG